MRLDRLYRSALVGALLIAGTVLTGASPAQAATGSITGHLTTATGGPASDAWVQIKRSDSWDWVAGGTTDSNGDYTVPGLAAGSYLVSYYTASVPEQYYSHKISVDSADPVTVGSGQTVTVNDQFIQTSVITGQIRDTAGNPVAGLGIDVRHTTLFASYYAQTDGSGRYRVEVFPGTYTVSFQPIADSYQEQFVPGKVDRDAAAQFDARAGEEVVADDTVLPSGTIVGRLTTAAGQPVSGADVTAHTPGWSILPSIQTDSDGRFTFSALAATYLVNYSKDNRFQYYKGKLTTETADTVTVAGGQTTTISDSWLPTGSVRVTATDAVTGRPIASFCVDSLCSGGSGSVTVPDLPQGPHDMSVYTEDHLHFAQWSVQATVQANKTIDVAVKLQPGAAITTSIVDRATGKAVADVCLDTYRLKDIRLPEGRGDCSDANGKITVGPIEGGDYHLFAVPPSDSVYGQQWVGAIGGTGDERNAMTVPTRVGATIVTPTVRLDRAGSVTGKVTDAAGTPAADVSVSVVPLYPSDGPGNLQTGADGTYRISGLGPYKWPLLFSGYGVTSQWSGGTGDRFAATGVQVTAGGTATFNTALSVGTEAKGAFRIADGRTPQDGFVYARNSATGDPVGVSEIRNGQYDMHLMAGQSVFLQYEVDVNGVRYQGRFGRPVQPRPQRTGRTAVGAAQVAPATATSVPTPVPTISAGRGGPIAAAGPIGYVKPGSAGSGPVGRASDAASRAAAAVGRGIAGSATFAAPTVGPDTGQPVAPAAGGRVPVAPVPTTKPVRIDALYVVPATGPLIVDMVVSIG